LGDVIQADIQLASLSYSVVLSSAKKLKNILHRVFLEEKLRLWGEELADCGSQMFPLGIQHVLLSLSECSCKVGFTGSPSEFAAWSSL